MKELVAKSERAQADLKNLETNDKGQLSKTDPDARLLSKGDQTIAGYNVQNVVDDKHMLIVASEVVNRSDAGHLHEMAMAAKEALDVETLQAAADTAYYNSEDLKAWRIAESLPTCRCTRAMASSRRKVASAARISTTTWRPMPTVARLANCCVRRRDAGPIRVAAPRSVTWDARRPVLPVH